VTCNNGISAQPGVYSSFDENDVRRNSMLIGEQKKLIDGTTILMDNGNPLIYTEEIVDFVAAAQNEGVPADEV
jgi:hypothetical protein